MRVPLRQSKMSTPAMSTVTKSKANIDIVGAKFYRTNC